MPPADAEPLAVRESAWERAKTDAASVYRSSAFGIAVTLVELVSIPVAVLFTVGADTALQTQLAVPVLSGAVALVLAVVGVFAVQLAAAPVRQRNELRHGWTTAPAEDRPDVEMTLRNYIRRGDAVQERFVSGYSSSDVRVADEWAEEVSQFLVRYCSPEAARAFLTATSDGRPYERVSAHVASLREIVDQLL
jgi:hypothetical protein